jgi:hypothetical protein
MGLHTVQGLCVPFLLLQQYALLQRYRYWHYCDSLAVVDGLAVESMAVVDGLAIAMLAVDPPARTEQFAKFVFEWNT